jgi:hypothetical protein
MMARPNDKPTTNSFLDTSVAYKLQTGTSAHREYLLGRIPRNWYINNYVRMEYYRTCLIEWIYLYFESADARYRTFGDAFKSYAEGFGRQSKTAVNVVCTMELDGYSFINPAEKEVCRQKLQDFVFEMAFQFQEIFTDMGKDPTRCARVPHPIRLPDEPADRDEVLRRVAWAFDQEKECRSRCSIHNLFEARTYKDKMEAIASASARGKAEEALDRIRAAIAEADAKPSGITCQSCSKMGDAVIATLLDSAWKLHSLDTVHGPISEAIGLEFEIHPSDAALRKASKSAAAGSTAANNSKPPSAPE